MPVLHFEKMINFSRFIDVFIIFSENKYDLEEAESNTSLTCIYNQGPKLTCI